MADGGGFTGNSRSSAPLDGAFLLQLLRNPPQSQNRSQNQSQNQQLSPFDDPHRDPAVAAVEPTYPSAVLRPQETLTQRLSPPNWGPPGFPPRATNQQGHSNLHLFPQNSTSPHANSNFPTFTRRDFAGKSTNNPIPRRAQSNADVTSAESPTFRHPHHRNHYNSLSAGSLRNVSVPRPGMEWVPLSEKQHHNVGGRNGNEQPRDSKGSRAELSFDGYEDELSELTEEVMMLGDELGESGTVKRSGSARGKEARIDLYRGHSVSSQRVRILRREVECRYDIDSLSPLFISIYKSLIPAEEEIGKQKQLLLSLRKLVNKEWPDAQLHLYGSCANSFGVSNSDIDICLAIDASNMSKSDILLRLADILQSDNLQNVQALTHARVPIVKMMDPATGISCDICINNLLAVANTKLLRDYALIDERLRQLAFIVKHWAKSRGVNETYRGTLSSYAYVLMCIHFLQTRRPAILPCLQEMEATFAVTIDGNRYAYFDQVDRLRNFGVQNNESVARLLWGFFHYWAYNHDYMNDVISIRTGRIISKRMKDWTRRIGNDRHLICIEDPFETSHDLGRVVDKSSIKILREEFERAADILQYDRNPSVTLFEPYVPRSMPDGHQLD